MGNAKSAESETSSQQKIEVETGDNSQVWLTPYQELRDAHEAHFTDIKIGVFAILGVVILAALIFLGRWCVVRLGRYDATRIDRRAMSMMRRRRPHGEQITRTATV